MDQIPQRICCQEAFQISMHSLWIDGTVTLMDFEAVRPSESFAVQLNSKTPTSVYVTFQALASPAVITRGLQVYVTSMVKVIEF